MFMVLSAVNHHDSSHFDSCIKHALNERATEAWPWTHFVLDLHFGLWNLYMQIGLPDAGPVNNVNYFMNRVSDAEAVGLILNVDWLPFISDAHD